jgi:hypothetical protein
VFNTQMSYGGGTVLLRQRIRLESRPGIFVIVRLGDQGIVDQHQFRNHKSNYRRLLQRVRTLTGRIAAVCAEKGFRVQPASSSTMLSYKVMPRHSHHHIICASKRSRLEGRVPLIGLECVQMEIKLLGRSAYFFVVVSYGLYNRLNSN